MLHLSRGPRHRVSPAAHDSMSPKHMDAVCIHTENLRQDAAVCRRTDRSIGPTTAHFRVMEKATAADRQPSRTAYWMNGIRGIGYAGRDGPLRPVPVTKRLKR